jgi:hypothetical protein
MIKFVGPDVNMIKFKGCGHDTCSIVTGVTSTYVDTISAYYH